MKKQGIWEKRILPVLCAVLLLTGCAGKKPQEDPIDMDYLTEDFTAEEINALSEVTNRLSVWSVYWDCLEDMDTLRETHEKIAEVSLFAAYFKEGAVVIPDATARMLKKIRNKDTTKEMQAYLSVVNDVETNGETVQKDTDILYEILGNEASAKAHAETLVSLAKENGYDGIEIDYEKIRSDLKLWQHFLRFEELLLAVAEDAGLGVRIVLETSTPVSTLAFPEGAEYSVMCYNLYGNGTEPGPKADADFLWEIYEKFKDVPNISYAFSNGGFDWEENSRQPAQVRAADAAALAEKYSAEPARDADSGALYFSYTEKNKTHTVWYADADTLKTWAEEMNCLSGGNAAVSLWRM